MNRFIDFKVYTAVYGELSRDRPTIEAPVGRLTPRSEDLFFLNKHQAHKYWYLPVK